MPNESVTKITPYADGKRRRMKMKKLTAVALTARGANPEANVTFFKSKDKPYVKAGDLVDMLTSVDMGHQHGINIESYDGTLYLDVGFAQAEGGEGHYHRLTLSNDGQYIVSTNAGHNHTIDGTEIQAALLAMLNKGVGKDTITKEQSLTLIAIKEDGSPVHTEDTIMPEETLKADLKAATNELAAVKTQLATAVAFGAFSDAEKAYHATLSIADQESFIAKSSADRKQELEMAAKADPIEYTAQDGTEYRKSAGSALISMAKKLDDQAAALVKQEALTQQADLVKRASSDMGNIPGEEATKVALLRAVDGIQDEETRKAVSTLLAGCNSTGSMVTTTYGTQTTPAAKAEEDQLDTMVKQYAADKNVDMAKAYEAVLSTAAGQALYNKAHH